MTQRYFVECKYNGSSFFGWQSQANTENTIQGQIEKTLAVLLRKPTPIVGCGRTDSGVHASDFTFHMDAQVPEIELLKYKLNQILPKTITIDKIKPVKDEAHARFDAVNRAYTYYLTFQRDPFRLETSYFFAQHQKIDEDKLFKAARLILQYDQFEPFCKSGSDVLNKTCHIKRSEWEKTKQGYNYHIEANRFLRGMVRLIVGMCLNVGVGKLDLEVVENCLKTQKRLPLDWSVPAKGLFLSQVDYPDELFLDVTN